MRPKVVTTTAKFEEAIRLFKQASVEAQGEIGVTDALEQKLKGDMIAVVQSALDAIIPALKLVDGAMEVVLKTVNGEGKISVGRIFVRAVELPGHCTTSKLLLTREGELLRWGTVYSSRVEDGEAYQKDKIAGGLLWGDVFEDAEAALRFLAAIGNLFALAKKRNEQRHQKLLKIQENVEAAVAALGGSQKS